MLNCKCSKWLHQHSVVLWRLSISYCVNFETPLHDDDDTCSCDSVKLPRSPTASESDWKWKNQLELPLPSAWRFPKKRRKQMEVSDASPEHSLLAETRCRYSASFYWRPTHKRVMKLIKRCLRRQVCTCISACKYTLTGGLASTGAPSDPPAKLFLRFSWTWVSRSSRSTLSASLARQASSSSDTRLFREDFLLSAPQKHKDKQRETRVN